MTTFKQFLTEDEQLTIEDIVRDCKPFLDQWEGKPLWRGIRGVAFASNHSMMDVNGSPVKVSWMKRAVRSDRVPKNTWDEASEVVDTYFLDKFGWRPRSEGLFVTGSYSRADQYGIVYLIFPIGQFNFLWSPNVPDLYYQMPERGDVPPEQLVSYIDDRLDAAKFQTDDLNSAIDHGVEITVHCKNYYALSISRNRVSDFCDALRKANDNL